MIHLPRAFRFDHSDLSVFDIAAEPGEWAVPGSFAFLAAGTDALTGKRRAAFANGFLGTASFGWTTLVTVEEASDAEVADVVAGLAAHFVTRHGAPPDEATAVARREVAFASSICTHPPGTILAISRRLDGDDLREQFKTITPDHDPCGPHAPIDLSQLARVVG